MRHKRLLVTALTAAILFPLPFVHCLVPSSAHDSTNLGFVWRGERGPTADGQPGRTPFDIASAGGIWARGFQNVHQLTEDQLAAGSSLFRHTNNPHGTREVTQYVSTSTSLTAAMTFALRTSPEHRNEVGYIYRIRTNWAMVDVNLSLGDLSPYPEQEEQAVVHGVPWRQILGWYEIRTADINRILGSDSPTAELGAFTRNPDFAPDSTWPSGAQPQLAGVDHPTAADLRAFVKAHKPRDEVLDQDLLSSIDWSAVAMPDQLRSAMRQGAASAAQCAVAAASILLAWSSHDLKRSIEDNEIGLINAHDKGVSDESACGKAVAVAEARIANEQPGLLACNRGPPVECTNWVSPIGECATFPSTWEINASTIKPDITAGNCELFRDEGCRTRLFNTPYHTNAYFETSQDQRIKSYRCEGLGESTGIGKLNLAIIKGIGEQTQIEKPAVKTCTLAKLTVTVQLSRSWWSGSYDRLFLEIGHNEKYANNQPHYLLGDSPSAGDVMFHAVDIEDAFDQDDVALEDFHYIRLASRQDDGSIGTNMLKVKDVALRAACEDGRSFKYIKTVDQWFTYWKLDIPSDGWK